LTITGVIADITGLHVDAIVNSANPSLLAGSGVSGAIHQAAGRQLEQACRLLGGCPVGEARLTEGFALPARYVIHAVGPRWWDGSRSEHQLLTQTYRSIFKLVREHEISSLAIPAISTRIHRFPLDEATQIAVTEARNAVECLPGLISIIFCCFDNVTLEAYRSCGVGDEI
jgi:O-acetyl-ADP-ribose deacetylase (regulator of RNase III)